MSLMGFLSRYAGGLAYRTCWRGNEDVVAAWRQSDRELL